MLRGRLSQVVSRHDWAMENISKHQRDGHSYQEFKDAETGEYAIKRTGFIPRLARESLIKLSEVGLHTKWRSEDDDMYPVRLRENGDSFWLEFGRREDHWAVPTVDVMGESQQSDVAILAALTNSEANPIHLKRLSREVLPEVRELLESGECSSLKEALERLSDPLPSTEGIKQFGQILDDHFNQPLLRSNATYIVWLLEYFRPGFDSYPYEDQIAWFEATCKRINHLLTASRNLVSFLEYGAPDRDTRASVENVTRDVRAAMLHEVGGRSYPQIGEVLGMPPPSAANRDKNAYPTVREMVKRGIGILEEAFGEEGWRERAQAMRREAKQLIEQRVETCAAINASLLELPLEEVRSHVVRNPVTGKPSLDQEYAAKFRQKIEEWLGKPKPKDQL